MVLGGPEVENRPVEGDIETEARHIFSLLSWRYTRPRIPANVSDVSDPDAETQHAFARAPNGIDRAVWPGGFVHVEDVKLSYNQGIPTA